MLLLGSGWSYKFSVKKIPPIYVVDRYNLSVTLVLYDPNFPFILFTVLHTSKFSEIRSLCFGKGHLLTLQ